MHEKQDSGPVLRRNVFLFQGYKNLYKAFQDFSLSLGLPRKVLEDFSFCTWEKFCHLDVES